MKTHTPQFVLALLFPADDRGGDSQTFSTTATVSQATSESTYVSWPPSKSTPINEFTTEGYISCTFPTLFPTSAADFVALQTVSITVGNCFKHLMMYEDG